MHVPISIYYTLLKWDVLQGERFSVDLDKCINLAAYQLQIEFPDFRPTVQHLKMLSLLPQSMCRNPKINNDETYLRILTTYEKLHTMQPAYAALLYIVEVQQCEGYGEETFFCKDGNSLEEITLGCSLDWIFVIRRPSGTTQKFRWEEVRELVANKRKLSIKCGENLVTSVFYFEDNEMCNYVSTVLSWKWRHARTDALQQRSARLSVQNLQGALPSFSQAPGSFTRRSNTNVNSVRPNSEMIVGSEFTAAGASQFIPPQPSTPQLTIRTDQNSQSTVNSIQSCNPIRPPQSNSALSASRSISIGKILPPASSDFMAGGSNSSSALPFIRTQITNVTDKVSPPVAGTCSSSASTFYVPAVPLQFPAAAVQQQKTSNGSQEDWLRHEQHEVLKRMLTERRRLNKIGSSPEINTLGKSVSAASGAKCKKHQIGGAINANNFVADVNNFSLTRKIFTSTPDLHSARLNQQQQLASFQLLQQQQPQSQPQTPLLPPSQMNGSGGHRIVPGQTSLSSVVYPPPIAGNNVNLLPLYCPPSSTTTSHHNINPDVGGSSNTSFYLQNSPIALRNGTFSQGQVIDENGQQQTIIYPIPPDAASYVQPPPSSTSIMEQILQQSPQLGHVSALQIPPQLTVQGYPPTTNSPPSPAAIPLQEESRRSSPKSNATSSHSETQMPNNGVNNSVDQSKSLPEFAEIEFSGIPAKSLSADYSVAVRSHNLVRNRGSKIYPYNENRLRLAVTNSNPDGYINASEVVVPIGRNIQLRYVISQAPIQKTIEDFWQMVWQTGARLIVMLVNPHQVNKNDTIPSYIPSQAKAKLTVGDFFLRLKNVSQPAQMQMFQQTTTFTLARHGERRTIYHLYCADFTEQGVPSSMDTFIGLIDAASCLKRHIQNEIKTKEDHNKDLTDAKGTQSSVVVSKSNSNTSKDSRSSDASRCERAQSSESGGWARKKLRFDQNGASSKQSSNASPKHQQQSIDVQQQNASQGPLTIIQCTDGGSDSGLYLLSEVLIRSMENNITLEVAQLLRDLRYQRMSLVKNPQQYKFIYDLVAFYERKNRLV
uniref:protein-tyrosine-phosphatase n=1 Tax=Meloidogyne enterolobii TaxID=390850 RepID=A0A6V7USD1_MELEN|nr:unnamed protein product [Meloidogyne enterolobii]